MLLRGKTINTGKKAEDGSSETIKRVIEKNQGVKNVGNK